jgi:hypothetical protein
MDSQGMAGNKNWRSSASDLSDAANGDRRLPL